MSLEEALARNTQALNRLSERMEISNAQSEQILQLMERQHPAGTGMLEPDGRVVVNAGLEPRSVIYETGWGGSIAGEGNFNMPTRKAPEHPSIDEKVYQYLRSTGLIPPDFAAPPGGLEANVADSAAPRADVLEKAQIPTAIAETPPTITYEIVRATVLKHSGEVGSEKTRAHLKSFDVVKATELDEEQWAPFVALLENDLTAHVPAEEG